MSTDIYINLDCGAELQITKIGDRFSSVRDCRR